ncbi:MAG: GIY-YIG nuclease family protein [bacterium]
MKTGYVYILASGRNGTLYIGVTSNLARRVYEHKHHLVDGFTKTHDVTHLVWFEQYDNISDAILREKRMKKWNRQWKLRVIEGLNPNWDDFFASTM